MNTAFLNAKNDFLAAAKRPYESSIRQGRESSVRIPGENLMIVKSQVAFPMGSVQRITYVSQILTGNVDNGRQTTRESTLHGNLYKDIPQIGGIVHTHSPYAILNSLNFSQVDLVTMHSELKLKYPIPVVDVATQAVTEEELPKVFEVIDKNPGLLALILKGHGIVTMDKTAVKAGQTAELIEETSMINWEQKKFEMLK